ncbi:hypothetical protein FKM82_018715 [Ascaphus truei]
MCDPLQRNGRTSCIQMTSLQINSHQVQLLGWIVSEWQCERCIRGGATCQHLLTHVCHPLTAATSLSLSSPVPASPAPLRTPLFRRPPFTRFIRLLSSAGDS